MIMYNLSCIWIIDTEYCPLSCIDLYNCESDFNLCFNADFFFSANDKIKDIKSKPKNTAQMVRHVYTIVIIRQPINAIKM